MSQIGHNSSEVNNLAGDRLRSIIERHERLEEEIKGLRADQKDILTEAKSAGYEVKIIRKILALRKLDEQERREQEDLLTTYLHAIGMG